MKGSRWRRHPGNPLNGNNANPLPAMAGGPPTEPSATSFAPPPGNHPLEIAARSGIGPLSPQGATVWHGNARPCVSCGQIVPRGTTQCPHCEQDLSEAMLARMRSHAGPWFVFEHVRPFPGVSLERIVRQIHRGVLTETSIVRGPATDYQWRFAVETPGLCRYFGRCWNCHEKVSPSDTLCPTCRSALSQVLSVARPLADAPSERRAPAEAPAAAAPLAELTAALGAGTVPRAETPWEGPPRVAGISATWIVAGLMILVVVALMLVTRTRNSAAFAPSPGEPRVSVPAE